MNNSCDLAATASSAANSAKKKYELSKKIELGLLLLAALAQCIPSEYLSNKILNWATVISTALALFIALLAKATSLEKIWQEARTVSESAKKMMWFYIMKVSPFDQEDRIADGEFLLSLDRLRANAKDCKDYLASHASKNDRITQWMSDIRIKPWSERKEEYFNSRILKQVEWYETKAGLNSKGESKTFYFSVFFEISALITAIAMLNGSIGNAAWLGFITTAAAVTLGWGKMQRHKQLSDSYSVIAQQLKTQKQLWKHINTEQEFCSEVIKTEELISRENTNWSVVVN